MTQTQNYYSSIKFIKVMGYIKYKIYKNTNGTLGMQNKYYARAYHDQTITLEDLAEHMSLHNTVFTKGTIHGVLMDMVACVRELLLDSKKVKLDNLAIFSLGLQSKPADTLEEFSASTNIVKAYINALGTGEISKKQLDVDARFRQRCLRCPHREWYPRWGCQCCWPLLGHTRPPRGIVRPHPAASCLSRLFPGR